jgi:DNA-directed RNA polymerase subunit RPC12/RpoP
MAGRGLYECTECEYRVYESDGAGQMRVCEKCSGNMKKMSVPSKGWLSE